MVKTLKHKNLTWVDMDSPTLEEVKILIKEYNIHPLVGNELLAPTLRSQVDVYDDNVYLIFHFPTIIHSHDGKTEQEIDFIVGKEFVITVHYGMVDVLHEFSKLFEVDSILDKERAGKHGGFMFYYMVQHLYQGVSRELDQINNSLIEIEKRVFDGQEHEMVREISIASRQLLNIKKSIGPHKSMLESFEIAGKKIFGEAFTFYLRAISEEYYKISVDLENSIDTLTELRVTNDSLLNTKSTDIMRILTILAFVTFPLSLFASLFGMNATNIPIIGQNNDFWIIIGIMMAATAGFFMFFKYKKWL